MFTSKILQIGQIRGNNIIFIYYYMLILIVNYKLYVNLWKIILRKYKLNIQDIYRVSITLCYKVSSALTFLAKIDIILMRKVSVECGH